LTEKIIIEKSYDGQITELREAIDLNNQDQSQKQEINEIIMLVAICMLALIIVVLTILIVYVSCLRKKDIPV